MTELAFEAATATWIGARERQEDALLTHVGAGSEAGLIVLSDGMGGHSDGDIASRTIVSQVLADLFLASCRPEAMRRHGTEILRRALASANHGLRVRAEQGAGQDGMGGTLLAGVILDGRLRWISVGDSPLYILRGGVLRRLNADHSLAPQIELMVARGEIDAETARDHPQRAILTSALTGGDVAKIDCPEDPADLVPGDVLLFASDGIAVLDVAEIAAILRRARRHRAQTLARRLMAAVQARRTGDQDNVTLAVVTVRAAASRGSVPRLNPGLFVPALRRHALRLLPRVRPGGMRP